MASGLSHLKHVWGRRIQKAGGGYRSPRGAVPSWLPGWLDRTAVNSWGPQTPRRSGPPPSTRAGSPEGLPTFRKFQLNTSPRLRVPQRRTPACNVAASGTPSSPRVTRTLPSSLQVERCSGFPSLRLLPSACWESRPFSGASDPGQTPRLRGAFSL